MYRYVAPGSESTEYRKSLRVEVIGIALLAFALALCGYGAATEKQLAAAVGVGLALVAALIIVGSLNSYAKSRTQVKASALAPSPVELRHRSI